MTLESWPPISMMVPGCPSSVPGSPRSSRVRSPTAWAQISVRVRAARRVRRGGGHRPPGGRPAPNDLPPWWKGAQELGEGGFEGINRRGVGGDADVNGLPDQIPFGVNPGHVDTDGADVDTREDRAHTCTLPRGFSHFSGIVPLILPGISLSAGRPPGGVPPPWRRGPQSVQTA